MKKALPWILVVYIVFVFIQSLAFKFSGSTETEIIFGTISDWMASVDFLSGLAPTFKSYGGYAVGGAELFASILLLIPATRLYGAISAVCVMSGAIFFHLCTPLGVNRIVDEAGNTDGGLLFFMAVGVWIAAAVLIGLKLKYSNQPEAE